MDNDVEKIKTVYDYAKFHLGLYTSVVAASIGIGKLGGAEFITNEYLKVIAVLGILFVVLAGVCGAMVAVHIPDYLDDRYEDFQQRELTAIRLLSMPVQQWLFWEHRFFWTGLCFILLVSLFTVFP